MNVSNTLNLSPQMLSLLSHVQMQIVSAIVLLILEINYFRRRKLPILSTRCFSAMMISAAIYLISDFVTVASLVYIDVIPVWAIRFFHQIFIMSINTIMLCIFLYVSMITRGQRRFNAVVNLFVFGLYLLSLIVVIFGKLDYHVDGNQLYSYGPMAKTVYVIAFIYVMLTLFHLIHSLIMNPGIVTNLKFPYIMWTLIIWIGVALIQLKFPYLLISNLGVTLMCLLMYLGLESPGDFIDHESEALNYLALKAVLQERTNKKNNFYIINIDMENYGTIERTFGERIKNQLLITIANFLSGRFNHKVYRSKTNTFTLLIRKPKRFDIEPLITSYLAEVEKRFQQTWKIEQNKINISAHCDFIEYPKDIPSDLSVTQIIDMVDQWHEFSTDKSFVRKVSQEIVENHKRKAAILRIINEAISNNGIEMFYQPIYNIEEQKFTNAESLVRLKDNKTIGFISPEEFIPMAEKNGLIMNLSDLIFNNVFDFMSDSKLSEKGVTHIELNLSGVQSVDANLPNLMESLLRKYHLNPENINLEITESTAISSGYMLKKNMDELKKIGCTFSMDDFGTGYSNLSQMATIQYELIKIDKSLLWPCFDEKNPDKEKAIILLENMIKMILKMGMKIVVEGVETQEQFEYLKKLGVTYIQGYYFSKPLPKDAYLQFLTENN